MRVIIFQWGINASYGILRGLLELTGEELRNEGFEIETVFYNHPGWQQRLRHLLTAGNVRFVLGMSGIGSDLYLRDGPLLWEKARVPFFNWNCDHPCYYPSRHAIRNPYLIHGYVFPDHARYAMRHLNSNGMACVAHSGIPPQTIFAQTPDSSHPRNGRILFAKTYSDTNAIENRWSTDYRSPVSDILFAAAEELFHRNTSDFFDVIAHVAETHGLMLSGGNALTLMLIREVDAYLRYRHARLVVETLASYPVDVYGSGWDWLESTSRGSVYRGTIDWPELVAALPDYLGCLSINPLVDESVHDRGFFALAANVVPLADSNRFSRARMPELERYSFRFDAASIRDAIESLLADPRAALEQTENVRRQLEPDYSMREMARCIAAGAQLAAMNASHRS